MADENLLATFEQSLRQARATRARMATRLSELEAEADKVRGEMLEVDALANQTEAAIYRLLTSMMGPASAAAHPPAVSDAELEAAMRQDAARGLAGHTPPHHHSAPGQTLQQTNVQPIGDRFLDRTIPQAATMLLREAGGPLHVNEILARLKEGGFLFTGHNPTISIAVSLNRNRRFRKVAPGTFDLIIRDAAQASNVG
ncbi:MAG: hypothetical protein WKF30_02880 [Pyrinomonadaceae bacterium]